MAKMREIKAIKINDGEYNGTYFIGDDIDFFWITKSNSFKKYYEKYCKNNVEDYGFILNLDLAEFSGILKGWTETDLLIDLDVDEIISIPIKDIDCIWM